MGIANGDFKWDLNRDFEGDFKRIFLNGDFNGDCECGF